MVLTTHPHLGQRFKKEYSYTSTPPLTCMLGYRVNIEHSPKVRRLVWCNSIAMCLLPLEHLFLNSSYMKPQILPWFRPAIAGFSPLGPGFDPTSVHVKLVVDKMALEPVFLLLLRTSPSVSSGTAYCYFFHKDKRVKTENLQIQRSFFRISGSFGHKSTFPLSVHVKHCSYNEPL